MFLEFLGSNMRVSAVVQNAAHISMLRHIHTLERIVFHF